MKEITDAGVPDLANTSSHQVRLRSIKIVDQPRPLHILNVRAYNINHVGYEGVLGQEGDLPSECPGQFVPHPIDSFTLPTARMAGNTRTSTARISLLIRRCRDCGQYRSLRSAAGRDSKFCD
ncbi:MAG TPA: hypothetical protein VF940_15635 [Streptosporangiaceae bacterium]